MLYVFAALAAPSAANSGMSNAGAGGMAWASSGTLPTLHTPTLAVLFALLLVASTVRDLDRRADLDGYFHVVGRQSEPSGSALAAAGPAAGVGAVAPAVVKACQVTTSVTMAFMLIMMI
jgi:hypothetical protein